MEKDKKTYAEKLRDPRWQKKRLEIMGRDNFTCQRCGATDKTLHVHHKFYSSGKEPWEYNDEFLITLCEKCHAFETEFMQAHLDDLSLMIRQKGDAMTAYLLCCVFSDKKDIYPIVKILSDIDCFVDMDELKKLIDKSYNSFFNHDQPTTNVKNSND